MIAVQKVTGQGADASQQGVSATLYHFDVARSAPSPNAKTGSYGATWGDGLADQPLSAWWYAREWGTVDSDELLVFNPYLPRNDAAARQRLCLELLRALALEVARLSRSQQRGASAEMALLGRLTTITYDDALALAAEVNAASPQRRPVASWTRRHSKPDRRGEEAPSVHTARIATISALDRCLRAATQAETLDQLCLEDAVVASSHTGVNAAYLFEHFDFAHELFTAAAWLSYLRRGRQAYLPPFVAATLVSLLGRPKGDTRDAMTSYIERTADEVTHSRTLIQCAKRSALTGTTILVKPRAH